MSRFRLTLYGVLIILVSLALFLKDIPPSPLYGVKIIRENLQSLFVFGNEDRASFFLTLSDKRLEETEKLKNKNLNFLAKIQLNTAKEYSDKAYKLLLLLKDKTNTTYIEDNLRKTNERIGKLESELI